MIEQHTHWIRAQTLSPGPRHHNGTLFCASQPAKSSAECKQMLNRKQPRVRDTIGTSFARSHSVHSSCSVQFKSWQLRRTSPQLAHCFDAGIRRVLLHRWEFSTSQMFPCAACDRSISRVYRLSRRQFHREISNFHHAKTTFSGSTAHTSSYSVHGTSAGGQAKRPEGAFLSWNVLGVDPM